MASKFRALLCAIAAIAAMSQWAYSNTLYFPHVPFGGVFSTTFTLTNTGTTAVTSALVFYDENGNPRADLTRPVSLAAGASTRMTLSAANYSKVWGELNAGS